MTGAGSSVQTNSQPMLYNPLSIGKQTLADAAVQEEEDGLDELTALCMNSGDLPNAATAMATDALKPDLNKVDTSDSAQMASLLHMLQSSSCQQPQVKHTSAPGCKDNILGLGTVDIMVVDDEADDESLVSNRQPILDINSNKAPPTGGIQSDSRSVALATQGGQHGSFDWLRSTVSGVSASCSTRYGVVGGCFSDAITATSSDESASTVPYGGASGSVASVPSVLFASSPLSASVLSGASLLYVAVFLTRESREVLLSLVPAVHPLLRGDHMTLAYRPSASELLDFPLGAEVELQVLGTAADSRVQAVFVSPPGWLKPTSSVSAHVTISVAVGAKAVEAGHLIKDALQQAAQLDDSSPHLPNCAGSYQPFDEPLPLIGRLGVRMAVPAAVAAALGAAGSLDLSLVQPHSGAGDCELVMHSMEDLIRSGCVSISSDALEYYYSKHAGAFGKQVPSSCVSSPFTCEARSPALHSSDSSQTATLPPCAACLSPLQLSPAMTPPDVSHWCPSEAAAAAGSAAVDINLLPDSPRSSSGSSSQGSSGSGDSAYSGSNEAVQFLSAVKVGDYVAVRPIVPTEGYERLLQGYVCEFACDEPFQANGVLAVLSDNTIGYVVQVLDSAAGSGQVNNSISSPAKEIFRREQPTGSSPKQNRSSKTAKGAAFAYPVDPASVPGCSSSRAAAAAAAYDSSDPITDLLLAADAAAAASADGGKRRNARDAERDLQLWKEFDALQREHGEALCNSILESCNKDFAEAIALLKAQATTLQAAQAAAASCSPAAATAACSSSSAAGVVASAAATAADEELVRQLALSLGLSADSAVQLARLVPHMPADRVVAQLQEQQGDVNKAADALLAGGEPLAAGSQHSGSSSPESGASAGAFVSPAGRAAAAFMAAKDPGVAVGAQQLCEMCPGLQLELAELLLQENGGNLSQAARALSDMQASELEARTSAAATSSLHTAAAAMQGVSPASPPAAAEMSEADQLAILAAMGELDIDMQPQLKCGGSPKRKAAATAASPSPPRASPAAAAPGPEYYYQAPSQPYLKPQLPSRSPPPPPPPGVPSPPPPPSSIYLTDMETKRTAKEAADALYAKAKSLNAAAEVFVTVAQDLLAQDDKVGYKEKLDRAKQARNEAKAAIEEAQRLSWAANNKRSNCWEIDLHGLGATRAMSKFEQQFNALQMLDHPGGVLFRVIVGQGHHSDNNVPKIKLGVLQYLQERAESVLADSGRPWGVAWEVDPTNPGIINISIPCNAGANG